MTQRSYQSMSGTLRRGSRLAVCCVVLLLSSGCVSTPPPIQEMSDARQAVAAARDAGAETFAPLVFKRSTAMLLSAERTLKRNRYRQARDQALAARRLAIEAMVSAPDSTAQDPEDTLTRATIICRKIHVSGRVQGVFFRASTAARARELGLSGCAINLADGRVEVVACGDPQALEQLTQWLHDGPKLALVSEVHSSACACVAQRGFVTG